MKFLPFRALNAFTKGIQVYPGMCQGEYVNSVMQMRAVFPRRIKRRGYI